ncbi:FAD linked oxidase domain protein [Mycolicibacterium rhodesiae JS60]|nr:FAD linked oxidase domain protein [Mycolicibacterium rhodesiae JS60]
MGYSTNDGLVISVRDMNSVRHQAGSNTIVTGGGARNQDVAKALKPANVMIPGGQCPTVGVAGLTLGGGLGFSMRSFGVTSDSLAASQAVLANGDIVTASAAENPDLFWALRGGTGGNFGINTEFTYTANPAKPCTHFAIEFPADRAATMLDAWFTMLATAPREIGLIWYYIPGATPADKPLCGTWGQMYGSAEATREVLSPVIAAGRAPITHDVKEGSYWDAVAFLGQSSTTPHAFRDRSRFLDHRLDADAIGILTDRLDQQPHHRGDVSIFAWGGAIRDTAADATAFVHRGPIALMKYSAAWLPGDDATRESSIRWVNETFETMEPFSTRRSFQNFPDGELHDWAQAYYGDNLSRLSEIKRKYDPTRTFAFPQAIPSA